jgi:hypothetical protein
MFHTGERTIDAGLRPIMVTALQIFSKVINAGASYRGWS